MYLTTESGVLIDVEAWVTSQYGYDIRCEVCCEEGTVSLPEPAYVPNLPVVYGLHCDLQPASGRLSYVTYRRGGVNRKPHNRPRTTTLCTAYPTLSSRQCCSGTTGWLGSCCMPPPG